MSKLRAFLIFGTRPEAIKMAPVVAECRRRGSQLEAIVCSTGQHRGMLTRIMKYFGLHPDADLRLMTSNQPPGRLVSRCLDGIDKLLVRFRPDCVVAQGDTSTAMAASLGAFYHRLPFVHVEAGLRTYNLQAPWPEELNRRITDMVASLHCAPTYRAAEALLAEGCPPRTVHVTGNTVIDALLGTVERVRGGAQPWQRKYSVLGDRPMILITSHRRENFGSGFTNICRAISILAKRFARCSFIYPVHRNPHVRKPSRAMLGECSNIHLLGPVNYPEFVWLMNRATLILTDSGGVQEEAPSLRKPVLIMRETTERPEVVEVGAARLVGTSVKSIVENAVRLLTDHRAYANCQIDRSPYGDGHAARRIVDLMLKQGW